MLDEKDELIRDGGLTPSSTSFIMDVGKDIPAITREQTTRRLSIDEPGEITHPSIDSQNFLKSHNQEICTYLSNSLISLKSSQKESSEPQIFRLKDKIYVQLQMFKAESALGNQALKSDMFSGLHRLPMPNLIPGCSNFRQVENSTVKIFGVSQPTIPGIRNVIKYVAKQVESIVWVNLREEPMIYLNQKPFCCREMETLDINLEYLLGIAAVNLQELEERLRADLISLAKDHSNTFDYYYQGETMVNELFSEVVSEGSIKTVRSVFEELTCSESVSVSFWVFLKQLTESFANISFREFL